MEPQKLGMAPICPDCGSNRLIFEGQLQWDAAAGGWEVVTEPDFWLCRNCDDHEMRSSTPNYVLEQITAPPEQLCVSGECPTCGSDNIEVDPSKTVYEADVIYVTLRCQDYDFKTDSGCPAWENRFDIVSTEVD